MLATGYRYEVPAFLGRRSRTGSRGTSRAASPSGATSASTATAAAIFVQNAELHTHGFVAPDLGMAAYRNSLHHARAARRREPYPIERSIAFQEFGAPEARRLAMFAVRPVDPEADAAAAARLGHPSQGALLA